MAHEIPSVIGGEQVVAVRQIGRKTYLFTNSKTHVIRLHTWWDKVSMKFWRFWHAFNDDPRSDKQWCDKCFQIHPDRSITTWAG